jgi:outer membrane immunogenic protein
MKKLVPGSFGLILLTILSGSAMAADLSLRPPVHTKAPTMAPGYIWTGLYYGINGGGGWGASRFDFPGLGTTTGDFSSSGGLVGGTIGVNWQTSNLVFGVEGDGDWANIKGSSACQVATFTCTISESWLATARAREGMTANDWLLYITGGGAFGDVQTRVTGPVTFAAQSPTGRDGRSAAALNMDLPRAGALRPSTFTSISVPRAARFRIAPRFR